MKSVRKITPNDTYFIRQLVLRNGMDLPCEFDGDFEDKAIHLGAFNNDTLVGIVSLMKHEVLAMATCQYQLRGMATLKEVRGQGYGTLLIQRALEILKERQVSCVWCNARLKAVGFYKKHGFELHGNAFDIPGVGSHYKMIKTLNDVKNETHN